MWKIRVQILAVLVLLLIFMMPSKGSATEVEFKDLSVTQIINKYLSDRDLEGIEGLWIYKGTKGPILLAVLSGSIADIESQYGNKKGFVGIHLQKESLWDKGEKRFTISKVIDPHKTYKGSWEGIGTGYIYGIPYKYKAPMSSVITLSGNHMNVETTAGVMELERYFPSRNPGPGIAGTGSGFFISPTMVITNHHVIDSAKKVEVRTKDGRWLPAKVLIFDEDYDTAILEVIGMEKEVKPLPIGELSTAKVGQRVYSFGFPRPDQLSGDISTMQIRMNEGIITSFQGYKGSEQEFQHSIPTTGGNSGGPMMNAYGEVFGIVSSVLVGRLKEDWSVVVPQNINFSKRIHKVVELVEQLERSRELNYLGADKKEYKPEVLAELATNSVVLVRIEGYRRAKSASSSLLKPTQK